MNQAQSEQSQLNIKKSLSRLRSNFPAFQSRSSAISLEQEIENSVNAFLIKKGIIPRASDREELKNILYHNLRFNRKAKKKLNEVINWDKVNFDIATTARDCLAAYALVFSRYEPLGFNDLTLINEDDKSINNQSTISGLTYDDNDKRAVTVIIRGEEGLNGTLRLISGDTALLPAEILFNKQMGLEKIRKQQTIREKTISEISKLALSKNAKPMVHYRTLLVSKSLIARPLNIGNEISVVPKSEFDRRYKRIGFFPQLIQRFYRELEEPDVICSWDQDTQLSEYYLNIVENEMRKGRSWISRRDCPKSSVKLMSHDLSQYRKSASSDRP